MSAKFVRKISRLSLEEKILNGGALIVVIGTFFPWISGEWLGGEIASFSGLGFYTAFLGAAVLALNIAILVITLVPLTGGPTLFKSSKRNVVRLSISSVSTILLLGVLSVLTQFTFEFSRMEIRFGIYMTLIGSIVTTLYCFLRLQEHTKRQAREFFHQDPEMQPPIRHEPPMQHTESSAPEPPKVEEHHLHRV